MYDSRLNIGMTYDRVRNRKIEYFKIQAKWAIGFPIKKKENWELGVLRQMNIYKKFT